MGSTIGDILPLALGVALSPLPIVAVILMLFTKNARKTSLGFLVGWFLGVTVVAVAVVFIANPAQQATGGEESLLYAIVHIALGLLLLVAAYRDWKKRPKPGEEVAVPKWMASIDSFTVGKALGMGALLSGVNPKNLALILSAGVTIAAAGLDATQTIVVLVIFIFIACVSVAAPVVVYLVLGDKATPVLNSWKAWLTYNNATVMMVLFLVFGVVVLSKGLGAL
jgi:threonine/homoserine/homoserine lactone efflux protein